MPTDPDDNWIVPSFVPPEIRRSRILGQTTPMQASHRQGGSFQVVGSSTSATGQSQPTSTLGETTRTHTVMETEVAEGISQYELHSGGRVIGPGLGSSLADALLGFAIELEAGEDRDLPDN